MSDDAGGGLSDAECEYSGSRPEDSGRRVVDRSLDTETEDQGNRRLQGHPRDAAEDPKDEGSALEPHDPQHEPFAGAQIGRARLSERQVRDAGGSRCSRHQCLP